MEVSEEVQMGLRGPGTVIASESVTFTDPLTVAVADAKSLYDASASEQAQGDDDRSALEIGVMQRRMFTSRAQCFCACDLGSGFPML